MDRVTKDSLLEALLDSWTRNNAILVNLLRATPASGLDLRAAPDSPTVGQMFMHIHYVRLVFVEEDAPEFAVAVPQGEWQAAQDTERMAALLDQSADVIRNAVEGRLTSQKPMEQHYDHPILMLQHMIWHEGYHHGQIKLALKLSGHPQSDEAIGPLTWSLWMKKRKT